MFLRGNNWQTVVLLMVVCLIPVIYKEAFSGEGVSLSRIASSILYTLPWCFLVACIRKKWVFAVVSSILMMVSFVETIMVVLYKNYVIAGNIIAALTTTSDEGMGFVMSSLHALPWTTPVFIAFGLSLCFFQMPKRLKAKLCGAGLFAVLSVGFLTYQLKVRWGGDITTKFYVEQNILSRPPYNFWFQIYNAIEQQRMRSYIKESDNMTFSATRPLEKNRESYVLVIGESLRYDNLSLAGYHRNTTPLLGSLEDLTLFSDYYSSANLTMFSVPQIITRATADNFMLNYKEKSIIKPFQECGFKAFVICAGNLLCEKSSSYLIDGCDGVFAFGADGDAKIAGVVDSLVAIYPKTFFVIQFKGNHGPYNNFGQEHNAYRPNPVYDKVPWTNHEAMVNAYDNTVLFTDYNVYHIIKAIDKPGYQSAFLMVSDHGADYDTGVSDHGGNCNPRRAEYHVPLIVWNSKEWGDKYPQKKANLLSNKNKPVNSDNVFYSVCDMADITIDKKYSKSELSVFAKKLKPHERKLLVPDGKNYIIVK